MIPDREKEQATARLMSVGLAVFAACAALSSSSIRFGVTFGAMLLTRRTCLNERLSKPVFYEHGGRVLLCIC